MFLAIALRIFSCLRTARKQISVPLDNGPSAEAGGHHSSSAQKPSPCVGGLIDDDVCACAARSRARGFIRSRCTVDRVLDLLVHIATCIDACSERRRCVLMMRSHLLKTIYAL